MRNVLKKSIIGSVIINALCFVINLISTMVFCALPLGIPIGGGEISGGIGFGLYYAKIYPLVEKGEDAGPFTTCIFEPISLLITLVVFFVLLFVIGVVRQKKAKQ